MSLRAGALAIMRVDAVIAECDEYFHGVPIPSYNLLSCLASCSGHPSPEETLISVDDTIAGRILLQFSLIRPTCICLGTPVEISERISPDVDDTIPGKAISQHNATAIVFAQHSIRCTRRIGGDASWCAT